jgi:hypothetical protein
MGLPFFSAACFPPKSDSLPPSSFFPLLHFLLKRYLSLIMLFWLGLAW